MAEYIERDALIKAVDKAVLNISGKGTIDALDVYSELRRCICEAPSADVAPVRHGRWKYFRKQGIAVCTNCSFERKLDDDFGRAISCPNCGAKMDGEETEK